jgi:hypothetical protein
MRNVKKLTAAVAMAIGTAGAGVSVVQADAILFPYVVSSPTVTTILSVVNLDYNTFGLDSGANPLHWRYWYKAGAKATDNDATCDEVNARWTSSPYDLVDVSVDGYFGDAMAAMFNDPSINAKYDATTKKPMSLLKGLSPVRAFAIVDNDTGEDSNRDLTAGAAMIIELASGAAWGYQAYDPVTDLDRNEYNFGEANERFGEVFGPNGNDPSGRGSNISYKPFAEIQTNLYVTPIGNDDVCTYSIFNGSQKCTEWDQLNGNLRTRIQLTVPDSYQGDDGDVGYDRDENLVSGAVRQNVTCVGAVPIPSLMTAGARNLVADTGGFSRIYVDRPSATVDNFSLPRTDEATVLFLEYNLGGTIDGTAVPGVVNNGYLIRER